MEVWSQIGPFYDKASQGAAVYALITYYYEIPGHGPAPEAAIAQSQGRMNSFVHFEVQDRPGGKGVGGLSELTLGLQGSLDMPTSAFSPGFYPMELEIKYLPLEEKTVTTISGAPDRRAGGDVTFDDGYRLPSGYMRWEQDGGPARLVSLSDHTF
jgi:hypothetical protein